jgi:hypothetical protein
VCGKSFSVQDTLSTHVEAIGLPWPCTVQQHPFGFASHVGDAAINKQDSEMSFSNINSVSELIPFLIKWIRTIFFRLILSEDLAWPTQFPTSFDSRTDKVAPDAIESATATENPIYQMTEAEPVVQYMTSLIAETPGSIDTLVGY